MAGVATVRRTSGSFPLGLPNSPCIQPPSTPTSCVHWRHPPGIKRVRALWNPLSFSDFLWRDSFSRPKANHWFQVNEPEGRVESRVLWLIFGCLSRLLQGLPASIIAELLVFQININQPTAYTLDRKTAAAILCNTASSQCLLHYLRVKPQAIETQRVRLTTTGTQR